MDANLKPTDATTGDGRAITMIASFAIAVLICSYAINAMDRVLFPLLLTDVRREYGFGLPEAGLLSTIFTLFTLGMALAGLRSSCSGGFAPRQRGRGRSPRSLPDSRAKAGGR